MVGCRNAPRKGGRMDRVTRPPLQPERRHGSSPNAMKGVPLGTPSIVVPQPAAPSRLLPGRSVDPYRVEADRGLTSLGDPPLVLEHIRVGGVVPPLGANDEVASELEG